MLMNHKEIFKYEYKRCFSKKVQLWIILCFLAAMALFWYEYRDSEKDILYRDIVEEYRGVSNQQKIDTIREKTAYYEQVLGTHAEVSDLYARGGMNDEEFTLFINDYRHAKKYMDSWRRLCNNAVRFEMQDDTTYFFYDAAWAKLFRNKADWVFILLFSTLFVPYFYLDIDSKLHETGRSYYSYPQLKRFRLRFAAISAVLFQVIWMAGEFSAIMLVSSLPDSGASVCSLDICSKVGESVSLLQFYVFRNIALLLKRVLDTFLLYCLSNRVKSKMQTTVILLLYLLITDLYYLELLRWLL